MLEETPEQLVAHLAHPNGWWRDTAQMLIVSRGDASAVPALENMTRHPDTNARLHSLWALQGLAALTKEAVLTALRDPQPRVRRAAVQLAEPWLAQKDAPTLEAVKPLAADPEAQVATQVFLAWRAAGQPAEFQPGSRPLPLVAAVRQHDETEVLQNKLSETARHGRIVYESLCMACHGLDGLGVKAADTMLAPPLAQSAWMADNGNIPVLTRILLKGQTGPINGVSYGAGLMPPLEKSHTDEQIAQVLTYAGERWHGWNRPVSASEISRIRNEIGPRTDPWTHEELRALKN
jgi:mono/diheme cytochrome c family protein